MMGQSETKGTSVFAGVLVLSPGTSGRCYGHQDHDATQSGAGPDSRRSHRGSSPDMEVLLLGLWSGTVEIQYEYDVEMSGLSFGWLHHRGWQGHQHHAGGYTWLGWWLVLDAQVAQRERAEPWRGQGRRGKE
eukprot:3163102-Rhodomonas_salina.1